MAKRGVYGRPGFQVGVQSGPGGSYQFAVMPPSAGQGPRTTLQAKTKVKGEYKCSACDITYKVPEGQRPHCPLCDSLEVNERLRDQIFELTNAQNMILNDLDRARSEIDNLHAMKNALEAISQEDLAWVKQVLYRWQADRGKVAIKATHGGPRGRGRGGVPVDGFLALFRDGSEPEVHVCNSVGGLALAGYLEEAVALVGQIKAMEMLVRAVMTKMPGEVP